MKKLIFILFGVLICGLTIAQDEVRMHGAGAEPVLDVKSASYNESTGGDEFTRLNPDYAHRTAVSADLLGGTPFELTDAFVDAGSEIPTDTYKTLTLWINVDIGTSTNVELRVLFKHTSAGSEEYREIYLGNPGSNLTTVSTNDYQFDSDSDQLVKISIDVTGVKYTQLQFQDAADGDGQIDTLYYTLTY